MDAFIYYAAADLNGDIYIYTKEPSRRVTAETSYWVCSGLPYVKVFNKNTGYTETGCFFNLPENIKLLTWENDPMEIEIKINIANRQIA